MAKKSGYVRLTYISVRTFAYGALRTYVGLLAYVRIRPSWIRIGFYGSSNGWNAEKLQAVAARP